jgi:hypothetical protein
MTINVIKTSSGLAAIASVIAISGAARAANVGDCAAVGPEPIYVAGSSAVKPFLKALGTKLAGTATIVYASQGSCVGVDDVVNGTKLVADVEGAGKSVVWDNAGVESTCDLKVATSVDIGVSDVFATSCSGITNVPATVGDFQGPIQVMNFVVPAAADVATQSISAEAAYLVFGFDPASNNPDTTKAYADGTPWTSKADQWIRGAGSGTQSMLGKAIGVLPGRWALNTVAAQVAASSGAIVTAVGTPTGNINATIGILASNDLDNNRAKIRGLAYQHYGQNCGYWPDSSSGSKDKLNVRTGRYPVWGPLHMLTKVNGQGVPTKQAAKDLIDYVSGAKTLTGTDIVTLTTTSNLVPQCAMEVSRSDEIGEYMSVNPTCKCFYDTARGGDVTGCKACDEQNPCGNGLTCSYGFCEAIQ